MMNGNITQSTNSRAGSRFQDILNNASFDKTQMFDRSWAHTQTETKGVSNTNTTDFLNDASEITLVFEAVDGPKKVELPSMFLNRGERVTFTWKKENIQAASKTSSKKEQNFNETPAYRIIELEEKLRLSSEQNAALQKKISQLEATIERYTINEVGTMAKKELFREYAVFTFIPSAISLISLISIAGLNIFPHPIAFVGFWMGGISSIGFGLDWYKKVKMFGRN